MLTYDQKTTEQSLDGRVQTNLPFWKIYLDTCCLSRLLDPPTQVRLIEEAQAIRRILIHFLRAHWYWISSKIVVDEVEQTPDLGKRIQVETWLNLAHQIVIVGAREYQGGDNLSRWVLRSKMLCTSLVLKVVRQISF